MPKKPRNFLTENKRLEHVASINEKLFYGKYSHMQMFPKRPQTERRRRRRTSIKKVRDPISEKFMDKVI